MEWGKSLTSGGQDYPGVDFNISKPKKQYLDDLLITA
jgi:hypothetical protein